MSRRVERLGKGLRYVALGLVVAGGLLSILATSSGDSDDDGGTAPVSPARVSIDSQFLFLDGSGDPFVHLEGTAWVSNGWVAHKCAGLCCVLCQFDDSYPGVDVTWHNQSNGATGTATSRYGTLTVWEHLWSANVPVVAGINTITVTAADPSGTSASAFVDVDYMP